MLRIRDGGDSAWGSGDLSATPVPHLAGPTPRGAAHSSTRSPPACERDLHLAGRIGVLGAGARAWLPSTGGDGLSPCGSRAPARDPRFGPPGRAATPGWRSGPRTWLPGLRGPVPGPTAPPTWPSAEPPRSCAATPDARSPLCDAPSPLCEARHRSATPGTCPRPRAAGFAGLVASVSAGRRAGLVSSVYPHRPTTAEEAQQCA